MGPGAVELVGEGVDGEVDPVEVVGDLPASVELAAPCSDRALDIPVGLGGSRREHPEGDAALSALPLELGLTEFRHMLDWPRPIGWRLTKGRGSRGR